MSDVSERACSVRLLFHSSGSETFSSWFSIFDIAPVLFLFHAVNAVAIEKNFYIVRINICWPQSAILLFFSFLCVLFFFLFCIHRTCFLRTILSGKFLHDAWSFCIRRSRVYTYTWTIDTVTTQTYTQYRHRRTPLDEILLAKKRISSKQSLLPIS